TQLDPDSGLRGGNWNSKTGGYQTLKVGSPEVFTDDASGASWLLNADYARDWQSFQQFGEVRKK
ncbi:MAG: hypothetical protein P1V20_29995, partial [Verrucomicrobiales bacterium]|nr:hypothetical protein [Verrucomicrobiales bacterium]